MSLFRAMRTKTVEQERIGETEQRDADKAELFADAREDDVRVRGFDALSHLASNPAPRAPPLASAQV